MSYTKQDVVRMVKRLERTMASAEAQLRDITEAAMSLPIAEESAQFACPLCQLPQSSEKRLVEHQENVHGVFV